MKIAATDKHPTIVTMPEVTGVTIVTVEPLVIVIVFDVEHVQVAIGVRIV